MTFKAKLIDEDHYYDLRRKQLMATLVLVIPIGVAINFLELKGWLLWSVLAIAAILGYVMYRSGLMIKSLTNQSSIIITPKLIQIQKGKKIVETLEVQQYEQILVETKYGLQHDDLSDIKNEIAGRPSRNRIEFHGYGQSRAFDMQIESHYMIHQLGDIIEAWQATSIEVSTLTT